MEPINDIVAQNVKNLRRKRKLSLEEAAKLTGISRSMYNQVEKGAVNPTLATIWKIAKGLGIPFSDLLSMPEDVTKVIRIRDVPPTLADNGKSRKHPLLPHGDKQNLEIWRIELEPNASMDAKSYPAGTLAFITVYAGTLEITVDGIMHTLSTNDSIRFMADGPYSYYNPGKTLAVLNVTFQRLP